MSTLKISRVVDNIRANTTVYTPIVEVIVNSIQAIAETRSGAGKIHIRARRSLQSEMGEGLPDINGFEIEDNGIGFTYENRESFDTLYTDRKANEGGKGFGRFICLKYFENFHVDSTFKEDGVLIRIIFSMGKDKEIIVNEKKTIPPTNTLRTIIYLDTLKQGRHIDKKLISIAKNISEKLLPYFISRDYSCPTIVLSEMSGENEIRLNDCCNNELSSYIKEIPTKDENLKIRSLQGEEIFSVRIFKIYSPKNQASRISLVAHKREVSTTPIHDYIPEFIDDFYDTNSDGDANKERNYIIKSYVFGLYLDKHVSLERGEFEFNKDTELLYGVSQNQIESEVATITKNAVGSEILSRQNKKQERVYSYVENEAPWHKDIVRDMDLTALPYNATTEDIEGRLQKEKFSREIKIKKEVAGLLAQENVNAPETVFEIVRKISENGKNDLIHYIALRRSILDLFEKSLQAGPHGAYSSEGTLHDLIFPRKNDSESMAFKNHNLWIIDERINFTSYLSSDIPHEKSDRTDLLVYGQKVTFRGDNEASNPITIFEFKKPQRDDFADQAFKEDPIEQIIRYTNQIKEGKYKTPTGRNILVSANTPFYGYVICDITPKTGEWLLKVKNFKQMPDSLGWFHWYDNINLYIEVIGWDKVLKDARMRNSIFFKQLGI